MLLGDVDLLAFGGDGSAGIDWTRGIVAIMTAAVLVVIASTRHRPQHGSRTRV